MINNFKKIINNKFSRVFKFVFFLRYLLLIFFISTVLFLTIPHFFDYKKKEDIIKDYLSQNYSYYIQRIDNIKFRPFPVPHLQLSNLSSNFYKDDINLESEELLLYPKLFNIYNYENLEVRKIKLKKNVLVTDFNNAKFFIKNIISANKKISLNNLHLKIKGDGKNIIDFKKIILLNYGYKERKIVGEVFGRKLKINFDKDLNSFNLKLLETGVSANLNIQEYDKDSKIIGNLKGKVLKSNFKFDFIFDTNTLRLNNIIFRDKKLSFDSEGDFKLNPFFQADLTSEIKSINSDIVKRFDINTLLTQKELIKRFNIQKHIIYNSNKFSRSLVNNLDVKAKLVFGRMNISKTFTISKSQFFCKSNINLLEDNPIVYFNCSIESPNKKNLLKKLGIKYKKKNDSLKLNFVGNLNVFNNKINFDKINMNENYEASSEDLKYFKRAFEDILFDKDFYNIFDIEKIRKFLKEII